MNKEEQGNCCSDDCNYVFNCHLVMLRALNEYSLEDADLVIDPDYLHEFEHLQIVQISAFVEGAESG